MRYIFGDFCLDTECYELRRNGRLCPLEPQVFDILSYLLQHRARIVSKQELLDHIWRDRFVSEGVLTQRLMEVRKALGDSGRTQQYIQTMRGRGYRFVAVVDVTASTASQPSGIGSLPAAPPLPTESAIRLHPKSIVAREAELNDLHQRFELALGGERQVLFITGEAGIGKTAVVDAFVDRIGSRADVWIGRGQCVATYGSGEPYRPVLEALAQLCRTTADAQRLWVLREVAPMWWAQMPWLMSTSEHEALQQRIADSRPERMVRELAEALEVWTSTNLAIVLILEDLHWSDHATLELLDVLARRREPARVVIISTYRSTELHHPLRRLSQELLLQGLCVEFPLPYLSRDAVKHYLAQRFSTLTLPDTLAVQLYRRTEGNPLFMVAIINDVLVSVGQELMPVDGRWNETALVTAILNSLPENLLQMVRQKVDQLPEAEQDLLEAASVAGHAFTTTAVAAALEIAIESAESGLKRLVQQHLVVQAGRAEIWPDNTLSESYRFVHALYRDVVYRRVSAAQRLRFHQRISLRLEQAYGAQVDDIAVELAMHCELGQSFERAVHYRQQAAALALGRQAHREVATHLTKGLELLERLPATPTRNHSELMMQHALGITLMTTKGFSDPDVERALTRARALCQDVGPSPRLFRVLVGLGNFHFVRGEYQTAIELAHQCLDLAQQLNEPVLLVRAQAEIGKALVVTGDFLKARTYLDAAVVFYDRQPSRVSGHRNSFDPEMICRSYTAMALLGLGYLDQAVVRAREAFDVATDLSHAFSRVGALHTTTILHQVRREPQRVQHVAQQLVELATEHGFQVYAALGRIQLGWAQTELDGSTAGIDLSRYGIAAYRATGAMLMVPYFLTRLAESYARIGATEQGLATLEQALRTVMQTGERFWEAELYRLQGLFWQATPHREAEAERCFHQALTIARQRQMKLLELRAALNLHMMAQATGSSAATREQLAALYGWFTEGFDTPDLEDAAAGLT